jgi:hypothetical protein
MTITWMDFGSRLVVLHSLAELSKLIVLSCERALLIKCCLRPGCPQNQSSVILIRFPASALRWIALLSLHPLISIPVLFPTSCSPAPFPTKQTEASSPKMGFLQSTILGSVSFLLGLVFVCQIPDIPLLYRPITTDALDNAYTFYLMWYDAPRAVKAVLHAALGLPLLPLIAKLNGWSESAVFFDGSSLGESPSSANDACPPPV